MSFPVVCKAIAFSLLLAALIAVPNSAASPVPPDAYRSAATQYGNAETAAEAGNFALADQSCENAIKFLDGYQDKMQIGLYTLWADVKTHRGDLPSAAKFAQQAVILSEKIDGTASPMHALPLIQKAFVDLVQAKYSSASAGFAAASQLLERDPDTNKRFYQPYQRALGGIFLSRIGENKDEDALAAVEKLLKTKGQPTSDYHLHMALASGIAQVGDQLYGAGKSVQAQPFFEKSIKLYYEYDDKAPGFVGRHIETPVESIILAMQHLSAIYQKSGRMQEAKKLETEAGEWAALRNRTMPH
jgi:tetratricopeptide (TPR) repeat protein